MAEWAQVRWTEARQLLALQGVADGEMPTEGLTPQAYFAALRNEQRRDEAVAFLGAALPRVEAIAWAGRVLDDEANAARIGGADRQALDHALRWLGDPSDDRRRGAMDASEQAGESAPERLLALAVFMSGGSLSGPDLAPVQPPADAAGRLAAGAVAGAAYRTSAPTAVLDRALDLGEKVAEQGLSALNNP